MSQEDVLAQIKSRAYWRIEIRPSQYVSSRLPSRAAMEALLAAAIVSFRGWPYPYYPSDKPKYNGNWLEGEVNWEGHKEYWRLYQSGQWVHYLAVHSAWIQREQLFAERLPLPPLHAGYIHVRDILFTLTEIFRFAVGLAERSVLDPVAIVSIQLHNTHDYMLWESDGRFFPYEYVNRIPQPISQEHTIPMAEIRAVADTKARDFAVKVYSVFDWTPSEPAIRQLAEDQKKLVERRL